MTVESMILGEIEGTGGEGGVNYYILFEREIK